MRNSSIKKLIPIVFAGVIISNLSAGTIRSQGTAGAAQLLIPVGAENIALGGTNISNVSGVNALYLNPAGAASMEGGAQVAFSSMEYIADINVNYMGLVASLGDFGNVGLSVKTLDFGDIPVTTAEETQGTGATFSPNYLTASANYSKSFADNVRFGTNLKYVNEQIMNTKANGLALDIGVQYQFNQLPVGVGVALKNLGGRMEYQGSDLEQNHLPEDSESGSITERFNVKSQAFELPAQLDIGLSYNPMEALTILGSFTNNSFSSNVMGLSLQYKTGLFWVAGGMNIISIIGDKGSYTDDQWDDMTKSPFGANFGAGVSLNVGELSLDFGYSVRVVTEYFENNNVLELSVNF